MQFIPSTGVTLQDLQTIADRMAGTPGDIQDHVLSLGLECSCVSDLLTDLEDGKFISSCLECGFWEKPEDLCFGLCADCEYALEDEDEDEDFGFDDDIFDEDDLIDEHYGDCIFDETDDEEEDDL